MQKQVMAACNKLLRAQEKVWLNTRHHLEYKKKKRERERLRGEHRPARITAAAAVTCPSGRSSPAEQSENEPENAAKGGKKRSGNPLVCCLLPAAAAAATQHGPSAGPRRAPLTTRCLDENLI